MAKLDISIRTAYVVVTLDCLRYEYHRGVHG